MYRCDSTNLPHFPFSPLQVLGHFKLLVILAAGIFLFREDANYVRLAGMLLAFAGIVSYTSLKQNMSSGWEKAKVEKPKMVSELPTTNKDALEMSSSRQKGSQ